MAPKTQQPELVTKWREAHARALWQDPKGLSLEAAMAGLFSPLPAKADVYLARDVDGTIIERGRQTVAAPRFVPVRFLSRQIDDVYHIILRPGYPARVHGHEGEPIEWFVAGASDRPAEFKLASLTQPNGAEQPRSTVMVKFEVAVNDAPMAGYSYGNLQKIDEASKARAMAAIESLPIVPTYLLYGGSVGNAVMAAMFRLEQDLAPDLADVLEHKLAVRFDGIAREQRVQGLASYNAVESGQSAAGTAEQRAARALAPTPKDVNWLPLVGRGTAELRVIPRFQSELMATGDPVSLAELEAALTE